jgi:transcriptional regulator with GAF, ATPase, and Fis domain
MQSRQDSNSSQLVDEWIAQEILRHPEQLVMTFMNAPNVGVGICDRQFRFRGINDALARMNGVPAKAHLGRTIYEVLGEFAAKVEPLFQHVLATGNPVLNVHVTGNLPMRSEPGHWVENYFPLKDSAGEVQRLCSMVVEVTEHKKLEESFHLLSSACKDGTDQLKVLVEFHSQLLAKSEPTDLVAAITDFVNRRIPHDYAALTLKEETLLRLGKDSTQLSMLGAGAWHRTGTQGIESVYDMDLATQRGVLGTLHLASRQKGAFRGLSRELAEQVAIHVALALEYTCVSKENETLKSKLTGQKIVVQTQRERESAFSEIVGKSLALEEVLEQARIVASTDATVLILGETGTGKDLVAHAIHRISKRKDRNFVKVNCAAIPTGLLESELFGHEKGAFTGATMQKVGRLELADHGTLLLDEIGDLPLELQPKLLRVLQDGEFERLGSTRTIRVNVRLIASTNRDLAKRITDNRFRGDLFYRLNVFPIRIPPLRQRREDIPPLAQHFVNKFCRLMEKNIETIPNKLMDALQREDWPGNVRELEHFIERSVIMTSGSVLEGAISELLDPASVTVDRTLAAVERDYILQVLKGTRGKLSGVNGAAAKLGMKRTTLQSRMLKLNINSAEFRKGAP